MLCEKTRKIGLLQYTYEPHWVGEIDVIHSMFNSKILSTSGLSPGYNLGMKF